MSRNQFKIQITNPCDNDWNAMKPSSEGRFCEACSKNVVDFSHRSDAEIRAYMLERNGENICGRFRKQQVDRIRIELDRTILQAAIPFWQKFLVVVLVCFGQDFLGVDFCFAQTDTTAIRIEQVDSSAAAIIQPDTVVCEEPEPAESIDWVTLTPMPEWVLAGAVSITQMEPITLVLGGFAMVEEYEPEEPEISLIDSVRTGTSPIALPGMNKAFGKDAPKPRLPKNTNDPPQNFAIVEKRTRRRRKTGRPEPGML
jgi:hypothetical protein